MRRNTIRLIFTCIMIIRSGVKKKTVTVCLLQSEQTDCNIEKALIELKDVTSLLFSYWLGHLDCL